MAKSLLEVLRDVSLDPNEQAAFSADPSGYLAQYGYEDVHPDDISEAFSLVADTLPPELAQTVAESQAAGQFGGTTVGADEGLAGNGVPAPTFGAGYEPVASDPDGADLVDGDGGLGGGVGGDGAGLDDAFDDDTAFGEGVGEPGGPGGLDTAVDDGGLGDLADDSGLGDTGFGQGGDSTGLDTDTIDVTVDDGPGVGAGYAETHGYDDGAYESADAGYDTDAGGYEGGYEGGYASDGGYGPDTATSSTDDVEDIDDVGSF